MNEIQLSMTPQGSEIATLIESFNTLRGYIFPAEALVSANVTETISGPLSSLSLRG
jgi:hypothetical protein